MVGTQQIRKRSAESDTVLYHMGHRKCYPDPGELYLPFQEASEVNIKNVVSLCFVALVL